MTQRLNILHRCKEASPLWFTFPSFCCLNSLVKQGISYVIMSFPLVFHSFNLFSCWCSDCVLYMETNDRKQLSCQISTFSVGCLHL